MVLLMIFLNGVIKIIAYMNGIEHFDSFFELYIDEVVI